MAVERVTCFIDGFNLYHAITRLQKPHLKWVSLWDLAGRYVRPASQQLDTVYYFSAYAQWLPGAKRRHEAFVRAQEVHGVTPVMGKFKNKDRWCPTCQQSSRGHEEKETDVNIALFLLDGAYQNAYDHALLLSRDSDLVPALRMLNARFPNKGLTIVAPPLAGHSTEMLRYASAKTKIRAKHLEQCLLPREVRDEKGALVAVRPPEYDPPS